MWKARILFIRFPLLKSHLQTRISLVLTKYFFIMVLLKRIMPLSLRSAFEKQFPKTVL